MASSIQRPLVGLASIIIREGKVLMGLRTSKHCNGMWGFPGGHLEMFESFEQCSSRETFEECGLSIPDADIGVWTMENILFIDEGRHYITIFTVAVWTPDMGEPENCEPKKCAGWEWFYWNEMPRPIMPGIAMLHEKCKYPKELAYAKPN